MMPALPTLPTPKLWTPDQGAPNIQNLKDKQLSLQPAHIIKLWRERPWIFYKDMFDVTLDDWQREVTESYLTDNRVATVANKGPGKAQPKDTLIYTPKGQRRFGDLKVGDELFGENGAITKVTGIFPQGYKPSYKVTFDDDTSTECCVEHLWKVRGIKDKLKGTWSVMSLKDILKVGVHKLQGKQSYYQWQIPKQGAVQFLHQNLPIDPYVMGAWLGDGGRNSSVISSEDSEILANLMLRGYKVTSYYSENRCPALRILGLKKPLRELGLLDKYSYEKSIPEVFKTASIAQRVELLKGLMDTDGTADRTDGSCEFNTTSEQLALDVQWLVRSLGGKSTLKAKRSFLNGVEYRLCYRVRVSVDFCPFTLIRKAVRWKAPSQERYLSRTIRKVETTRIADMTCISVEDPNHCYLTNDFIVTHNTALLALSALHFISTHHLPKCAALSVTKEHLKDNLWAEMLMWRSKAPTLQKSLTDGSQKIGLIGHEDYAFISARSYAKEADETQMASALAGLHANNVAFFIDEAGSIPDAVLATADAALSTGDSPTKKGRILVTANPERPSGTIYRASLGQTVQKWKVHHVTGDPDDPKRSKRVSADWAREQINTYGADHPWVLINVFGKYPKTSADQLLSESEIAESMRREVSEQMVSMAQNRLGLDVARGGADSSMFARRKGLKAYPMEGVSSDVYGPQLAGKAMLYAREQGVERLYVDMTGGYGSSVYDSLMTFNSMDVVGVLYQASAQDDKLYANKRTENWVRMRDWVRKGGKLPNDPLLARELLMPQLFWHGGKFALESKEQIKKRLGRSPDRGDALSQTFHDVEEFSASQDMTGFIPDPNKHLSDYEWAKKWKEQRDSRRSSYLSEESQLDNHLVSSPNYSS